MKSLTCWIDPLDAPASLQVAIDKTKAQAASISTKTRVYSPSVLLPTHYGQWTQSQCRQNLPPDLLVSSVDDIVSIRQQVEDQGVGFGIWGVPLDQNSAALAAEHAAAAGYYVANFEPTSSFWIPGDDPAALDAWWAAFWNALPDKTALDGNVGVTVIPNPWGMNAFKHSFMNLIGGANLVLLEAYGGPNTSTSYPYPNLWPAPSVAAVSALETSVPIACILANNNLQLQATQASRLSSGNLHSWYCR